MAKRISSSAVNWAYITETLNKIDRQKVLPLKLQSEKYVRDISGKPAELPKIEWNIYKAKIAAPGMVESFQRSYEALKIPYPSDQGELSKTETTNNEMSRFALSKHDELVAAIKELKSKLLELEKVMKFSDMTLEEFYLAKPELVADDNNPKFWPHHLPLGQKAAEKSG